MLNKEVLTGIFQNILPASYDDSLTYLEQLQELQSVVNQLVDVVNDIVESGGSGYILPTATETVKGGVKIGKGVNVDSEGTISVDIPEITPYELPIASDTILGGVKIGDGITITSDGKISVEIPDIPDIPSIDLGQGLKLVDGKITIDIGQNLYFTEDGKLNGVAGESTVITTGIQESINTSKSNIDTNNSSETLSVQDSMYYEKY